MEEEIKKEMTEDIKEEKEKKPRKPRKPRAKKTKVEETLVEEKKEEVAMDTPTESAVDKTSEEVTTEESHKEDEPLEEQETKEESSNEQLDTEQKFDEEKDLPQDKPKSKIPMSTIVLGIISVALIIYIVATNFISKTVNLSSFANCFDEKTATIKLPASFLVSDDGTIFVKKDGMLNLKGAIIAQEITEEDFNSAKESYIAEYGAQEVELTNFNAFKIGQSYEDLTYDYYFLFKDGILTQLVFQNCSQEEINSIINSYNY